MKNNLQKMDRTRKLLKKYGFIVIHDDYETGAPIISIKTTPESCILMTKRLQDILIDRHIQIKHNQQDPWTPQIQTVFDPAANQAIIYLYGVDDDLVADF